MFPLGGSAYVVAAFVFVLAVTGAFGYGYHERGKQADAEISALKANADKAVAQAREQAAKVETKVVVEYRDRVVKIREVPPEVEHDVQIIRATDCKLPAAFVRVYDASASGEDQSSAGVDDASEIPCADALEIARENNLRAAENAAKLKALQDWAGALAGP